MVKNRNIVLHISFDGTRYHGWQVQHNAVTVQQTLQDAIEKVFKSRLPVTGCSRTDAGVHANAYAVNFHTDNLIGCDAIIRALNANLPCDIAVNLCEEKDADFHARYSCIGKEYIYKIYNAQIRSPFNRDYALFYPFKLDCGLLDTAAQSFCGTHDFAAFQAAGTDVGGRPGFEIDTVRTISEAEVTRKDDNVVFRVRGDGFLYNMVRIMAGTLLYTAQGKLKADDIGRIIDSRLRANAGPTAPARGLYLNRVFYGGDIYNEA